MMEKKDIKKMEMHCILSNEEWEELINTHGILFDFRMRMQDDVAEKLKDITSNLKETEEMVFNKSGRTLFGNSSRSHHII